MFDTDAENCGGCGHGGGGLKMKGPKIRGCHILMLAGVILWVAAFFFSRFSFKVLGWEIWEITGPIRNLAVPSALVGTLVFVYGLALMRRKTRGGKTR